VKRRAARLKFAREFGLSDSRNEYGNVRHQTLKILALRYIFSVMRGKTRELWEQLCEQAAIEQDPVKMLELISEINRLLSKKEERLKDLRLKPDQPTK
jgi:hypothetical protein